jgi:hypothetical protein
MLVNERDLPLIELAELKGDQQSIVGVPNW